MLPVTLAAVLLVPAARAQSGAEAAFQKFFAADSPDAAAHGVADIEKAGVTFDEAWRRLKAGRTYAAQQSGVVMLKNRTEDGVDHAYAVNLPAATIRRGAIRCAFNCTGEWAEGHRQYGARNGRNRDARRGRTDLCSAIRRRRHAVVDRRSTS